MAAELRAGDVHICCCDTAAVDEAALEAAAGLLSGEEQARATRLVSPVHRRDFMVAHALLRRVLSSYHPIDPAAWTFIGRPGGKPVLTADLAEASGLSFNLTHTEGMVACAVTRGAEVGVDLEATDRRTDPLRLARRFFATQEAGELVSLPEADRQTRFVEVWTLKEAAVKALGTGLRLPLDDCVFLDDGPGRLRFVQAQGWSSGHWHFALLAPTDRHRLAVAMLSPGAEPPPRVLAWRQPLARAGEVPPATSAFPDALRVRG